MSFIPLTDRILVAPQIAVSDVATAAAHGVALIINNRPEGETPDQPAGEQIAAAAEQAGVNYVAIPVTHAGFAQWQIDALDAAFADVAEDARVLMFCRSGTRSTLLWALARSRAGDSPDALADVARSAGYDLSPIRQIMDALRAQHQG